MVAIRLIPIWLRLLVLVLIVVAAILGTMVGYSVLVKEKQWMSLN
ncbi:hypothetical protein LSPH24S_06424 [Lysinibacillus sphaericus]